MTQPADDEPLTLPEACEIYFRGRVGVPALKAEHARKQLEMWKVGRTWFTTIAKLKAMETKKCLDEAPAQNSGLTRRVIDGRSVMARASAAQAAVAMRLEQPKKNSRST
jgi:hypothetical protein